MRLLNRFLLTTLIFSAIGNTFAYQPPRTPEITLLGVQDASYPRIDAYLSVIDQQQQTPISGLTADDFFATTSDGQALTIAEVDTTRRPLHVVAVIDVTSSVSATELANQKRAVEALGERLQDGDQLGIVALTPSAAQVIIPPQEDFTPVLAALNRVQATETSGNAYWDAVYGAILLFQAEPGEARQAVILMTDVASGGGGGTRTEDQSLALAVERGVEIYGLYFEFEDDDIPDDPPVLPQELTVIAQGTGGMALGSAATLRGEDYRDDEALPAMMQTIASLLSVEYHLTLTSPIAEDGQAHRFEIGLLEDGTPIPATATGQFTAGTSAIQIGFTGVTADQDIILPFDLPLEVQANEGTLQGIDAFYIDDSGEETALGSVDPTQLLLSLSQIPPGQFRLRIVARDNAGNTSENSIVLNVVESFTAAWVNPPDEVQEGERVNLQAQIGLASAVTQVSLRVNGEERETITTPPFENVTFQWQPPAPGEYQLEVVAQDGQGTTASQEITLRVESIGGVVNTPVVIPILLGGIIAGIGVAGSGAFLLARRRRRQAAPLATVYQPIVPPSPTQKNILANAALETLNGAEKWRLVQGENTIGRHTSNMIQLRDESTSRYHAKIEVIGRRYFLSDWQASHPSEVNGVLIKPDTKQEVYIGDTLRIGATLLKLVAME